MRVTSPLAFAAALLAGTALLAPRSADAAFTFTVLEQGADVVGTGSGSLNLAGLTPVGTATLTPGVLPHLGVLTTGPQVVAYSGMSGPTSFGSVAVAVAQQHAGSTLYISGGQGFVGVAPGYVSGTAFTTGLTFTNASFAALGLTAGTYVWTWATDSLTLQIGPAAVPEPASLALLGAGLLGLGATMRRRRAA